LDIYEAIYLRRTVRVFQTKKIEMETLKKILNAGLQAPTNDHMRYWDFIILQDQASKINLIGSVGQNRTSENALDLVDAWGLVDTYQREMYLEAIPKQYQMLLNSGCLIIPCFRQKHSLLKPENLSSLNGLASIWCCIENILLAAAAEGIYGVTRIPSGEDSLHLKNVLKIPSDYEVPCYLALGYPEEGVRKLQQHPINIEDRMHFDKW
jgi:nitroreductase